MKTLKYLKSFIFNKFLGIIAMMFFLSSCSWKTLSIMNSLKAPTPTYIYISVADKTTAEYGLVSMTVKLSQSYKKNISFNYYTQDLTATAGSEYTSVSGTSTIAAGQTQTIIYIPISDNLVKAGNKKFYFNLSNLSVTLALSIDQIAFSKSSSTVEILDDDYGAVTNLNAISSGAAHTCAITTSGGAKCWGYNSAGQLGDNSTTTRPTPVSVSGLSSGVAAISSGAAHTCALTTSGGVKCWGSNAYGQLGDNTGVNRLTPVDVTGLTAGVSAISVGANHTCALTTSGGLKCWGLNANGQLGDNSVTSRMAPVDVTGFLSGASAVSAGYDHTCAITTSGGAKCWGYNGVGQLGDTSLAQRLTAVDVNTLTTGVASIVAGYSYTCAVTTAGAAKCWGLNDKRQLGDGSLNNSSVAISVSGQTSGVASISLGQYFACTLTTGGGVYCWGSNTYGQQGNGTTTTGVVSAVVPTLTSGVSAISLGHNHACALISGGIKCWGSNIFAQLGDNTTTQKLSAIDVTGMTSGVAAIANGYYHTCAITTSGGAKCWGENSFGLTPVGDGTSVTKVTATDVTGLTSGVASISSGLGHSCAVTTTGGIKCWGYNSTGQIGNGTAGDLDFATAPVDATGLTSGMSAVSAGHYHTCAITTSGGAKCWGGNGSGQLGDNSTSTRTTAVDVTGLTSGVAAIATGLDFTCALTTAGGVKCWGLNSSGQLGDNSTTNRLTAVDVTGLTSGVSAIFARHDHACALTTSGGVKCWGNNNTGQLGDNTTSNRTTPVDVIGLTSGVTTLALGYDYTCVLTTSKGMKCWGYNNLGQLGDGTTLNRMSPVDVAGLTSDVTAISAGENHTCAITTWGGAKCWGFNLSGRVGTSYTNHVPQSVLSP